jgi:hypothetical protein
VTFAAYPSVHEDAAALGGWARDRSVAVSGVRTNGAKLNANGAVEYLVGDLGDLPETTLDYSTISAAGWTIVGEEAGTRFTNDRTGRGMFVSIDEVSSY